MNKKVKDWGIISLISVVLLISIYLALPSLIKDILTLPFEIIFAVGISGGVIIVYHLIKSIPKREKGESY